MPVLLVLRHARAATPAGTPDHERPLDARGRREAAWTAARVDTLGVAPQLVLCSTAARARQTLEELVGRLAQRPPVHHDPDLYLADAETLLERVQAAPVQVDRLLVVSHNPGVSRLARTVARESATDRVGELATGALAVLGLEGPWRALAPGTAALTDLATPPPVL